MARPSVGGQKFFNALSRLCCSYLGMANRLGTRCFGLVWFPSANKLNLWLHSSYRLQLEPLEQRVLLSSIDLSLVGDVDVIDTDMDGLWRSEDVHAVSRGALRSYVRATHFTAYSLDADLLGLLLDEVPSPTALHGVEITLPKPDGGLERFKVVDSPVMAPELAAKFPQIKTFSGTGIDDPGARIRLDLSEVGFHAQVLSSSGSYYIDPYFHLEDSVYASYFAGLFPIDEPFLELDPEIVSTGLGRWMGLDNLALAGRSGVGLAKSESSNGEMLLGRSGAQLRTYRMAAAATGEYTTFHGGTVALGQASIVTAINRINGIYENEFAIRLQLVANNDQLIYTNASTDPYTNSDSMTMLDENQANIDSVIGNANYDIGHVFTTAGGGVAGLASVGFTGGKARANSGMPSPINDGFWVDILAHEIGHQFGARHTWNGNSNSCSASNYSGSAAYEPGSGSTIMSYAGICGNDNLQSSSDPYFHSGSFDEVISFVDEVIPSVGTRTSTGNSVPIIDAGADYTIPARTPFILAAVGSDANPSDVLTYNWEELDLGPRRDVNAADNGSSPLFRSFPPATDPSRTFPRLSDLVNNTTVIGETLPTKARTMNFRAIVRDNHHGGGGVNTDDMVLNVVDTGSGFQVTWPNTSVVWPALSSQTVTWDVASTTGSGINTPFVNILLSTDGGNTFPTVLSLNVPNDGAQSIVVPNLSTNSARIKVEGSGNIFFDISDSNFSIIPSGGMMLPTITDVLVLDRKWDAAFINHLQITGSGTGGYSISEGAVQLSTLRWNSVDRIIIRFSEQVSIAAGAFQVTGVFGPDGVLNGNGDYDFNVVTQIGATGQFEAVLDLSVPIGVDSLLIRVDGSTASAVTNLGGTVLDGEWLDAMSTFPSGNGLAGGDFLFSINSLPGDVDGDGSVTTLDLGIMLGMFGNVIIAGPSTPSNDLRADMDGDLVASTLDLSVLLGNFGIALPSGTPRTSAKAFVPLGGGEARQTEVISVATSIVVPTEALTSVIAGTGTNSASTLPQMALAAQIAKQPIVRDEIEHMSSTRSWRICSSIHWQDVSRPQAKLHAQHANHITRWPPTSNVRAVVAKREPIGEIPSVLDQLEEQETVMLVKIL